MVRHSHTALYILAVMGWRVSGVRGSALKCQEEGRFPHPDDCGSYVDCIPTGAGGQLEAREGYCFGFPYSPSLRRCVSHDQMPDCVTKSTRDSFPFPPLQFLCEGEDKEAAGCYHCKISYKCIGGKVFPFFCSDSDTCLKDERFGGGDCLPYEVTAAEGSCMCEKIGVMSDTYNKTYYIFCDISEDPPKMNIHQCLQGQTFSSESKSCEDSSRTPPKTPPCDGSTATRVNPYDCTWTYTCLPDGTVKSVPCDASQYFDENTGTCVEKCSLVSPPVSPGDLCKEVGNNEDPVDCTKYHICTEINVEPHSTKECPEGTHFDPEKKTCVSGQGDCTGFHYSRCPGYDDLNCP